MRVTMMNLNQMNADTIATSVSTMNRESVTDELLSFQGRFKLDFTRDYLDSLSLEQLRHILLAAALQAKNRLS